MTNWNHNIIEENIIPLKEIQNSVFGNNNNNNINNNQSNNQGTKIMNKIKTSQNNNTHLNDIQKKKILEPITQPTQPSNYNPSNDPLGHELIKHGVLCRLIGRTIDENFHTDVKFKDANKVESKQEWIFGRNNHTCTYLLPIQSTRISNKHFKLWMNINNNGNNSDNNKFNNLLSNNDNNLMIQDLSTNGTWLNNSKLITGQNYILNQGDEIAVGIGIEKDVVRFVVHFSNSSINQFNNKIIEETGIHKDFIIKDEIVGSGAFATVKKAIERSTGITYAAKIISKKKALGGLDGVSRELQILKKLDHSGIVRLKAFYEDDDNYYLVMEYISGGDLMDFVACNGAIDESASKEIAKQILEAIMYVHSKGISHRDLKPDNIMIAQDDPVIVKITDFGLAKSQENESRMKTFCGTLAYLAPEVITNKKRQIINKKRYLGNGRITEDLYSNKVDMWSIGCLLFVIMTAHLPFSGSTQDILFKHITTGDYHNKLLETLNISIEGRDFISRLLEVDVTLRLNATQALKHPWFYEVYEYPSQVNLSQHLSQSQKSIISNVKNNVIAKDFKIPKYIPKDKKFNNETEDDSNNSNLDPMTSQVEQISDLISNGNNSIINPSISKLSIINENENEKGKGKGKEKEHHEIHLNKSSSFYSTPKATFMSLTLQPGSINTHTSSTIHIPQGTPAFYIGRLENLNVNIMDERISKIHCMIIKRRHPTNNNSNIENSSVNFNSSINDDNNNNNNNFFSSPAMGLDDVWLVDFSTNTCYVNNNKIGKGKKTKLKDGDILSLFIDKKNNAKMSYLIKIHDMTGLFIEDENFERTKISVDEGDKKLFESKLREGLKQVDQKTVKKRKNVESITEVTNSKKQITRKEM
jgi:serine/threonine/tyrosine protein kinase RAD53